MKRAEPSGQQWRVGASWKVSPLGWRVDLSRFAARISSHKLTILSRKWSILKLWSNLDFKVEDLYCAWRAWRWGLGVGVSPRNRPAMTCPGDRNISQPKCWVLGSFGNAVLWEVHVLYRSYQIVTTYMTSACKAITVQYVNIVAMSLEESRIYMLPTAGSIWFSICWLCTLHNEWRSSLVTPQMPAPVVIGHGHQTLKVRARAQGPLWLSCG